MPQLNKGDTFADGQQVTGARLNQLVDNATLIPGAITDQTAVSANDIQSADQILVYDNSATALRKASISDVFGANIPITLTNVITDDVSPKAGNDVLITPESRAAVTGRSYVTTIASGVTTVTVTHVAHGLSVGSHVTITVASNTSLNGTYRVNAVPTADTFQYVIYADFGSGSGTLTYTKLATTRNDGNLNVNGQASITGNILAGGDARFLGTGAIAIPSGTTAQRPTVVSPGMIRQNTTTSSAEINTASGWQNIVTGATARLYEVVTTERPYVFVDANAGNRFSTGTPWPDGWNAMIATSASNRYSFNYVVPSDERWVIEYDVYTAFNTDDPQAYAWIVNGTVEKGVITDTYMTSSWPLSASLVQGAVKFRTVLSAGTHTVVLKSGFLGGTGGDSHDFRGFYGLWSPITSHERKWQEIVYKFKI